MPLASDIPLFPPRPARAGENPPVAPLLADLSGLTGPADRPLRGFTVLAVEDSRHACDLFRLLCQKLGARLRRAASLAEAEAHLRTYRPDLVIIDLGLPDGRGEGLIRRLTQSRPSAPGGPRPLVFGTSGDLEGRAAALAAGAQGFLDKPLPGIAAFLATLAPHLSPARQEVLRLAERLWARQGQAAEGEGAAPQTLPPPLPPPDPLTLRDDLCDAAARLEAAPDAKGRAYLLGLLEGLARITGDGGLLAEVGAARGSGDLAALTRAVTARIAPVEWQARP